mmetsp:Transcript_41447/g.125506  ORF Transcript_41447/g.125506 Transcript_41447/m.125506 type:complete len:488 (+) Transcript_41447:226-1689(+)
MHRNCSRYRPKRPTTLKRGSNSMIVTAAVKHRVDWVSHLHQPSLAHRQPPQLLDLPLDFGHLCLLFSLLLEQLCLPLPPRLLVEHPPVLCLLLSHQPGRNGLDQVLLCGPGRDHEWRPLVSRPGHRVSLGPLREPPPLLLLGLHLGQQLLLGMGVPLDALKLEWLKLRQGALGDRPLPRRRGAKAAGAFGRRACTEGLGLALNVLQLVHHRLLELGAVGLVPCIALELKRPRHGGSLGPGSSVPARLLEGLPHLIPLFCLVQPLSLPRAFLRIVKPSLFHLTAFGVSHTLRRGEAGAAGRGRTAALHGVPLRPGCRTPIHRRRNRLRVELLGHLNVIRSRRGAVRGGLLVPPQAPQLKRFRSCEVRRLILPRDSGRWVVRQIRHGPGVELVLALLGEHLLGCRWEGVRGVRPPGIRGQLERCLGRQLPLGDFGYSPDSASCNNANCDRFGLERPRFEFRHYLLLHLRLALGHVMHRTLRKVKRLGHR